ncbi:GNAT family N-acetyltransferase [Fictibacillus nanhaiensis]|uniref:GNAT family N-acetyltransferase n=1 Tax=Fictibacillus nanhaiensis TaxID=742169 RepID=UPI00203A3A2C|nr:GNAT family N-acetyltransferase [Fictibacillus nanhaiensis]MCM3731963.1 GNAT family N-acetyltransferase [Fictibacillus nanhaiensis]
MYIRKRIPGKDDPILVDMVVNNFQVRKEIIQAILKMANEVLVVIDGNDRIAGFVSYRFRVGNMILVDYVVLDTKHQGKGIASSFLPVFEDHLLKQGIRIVYGTVDEENTDALRVFQHWGFQVKGQIGSSIIIEKDLKAASNQNGVKVQSSYVRKLNTPPKIGFYR